MFRSDDSIGPYVLVEKLGQGQFGEVWLANKRAKFATTQFAVKLPLDGGIDLEAIRKEAEAWVASSGHPNVLPIIEADEYNGQVVIVSEYAPDGSLRKWLNRYAGQLPPIEAALEMTNGILAGLEHLHSRAIIHRDLKPDNILLQGDTPRIADFGVAKILTSGTQSNLIKGTPLYMAPEAFNGDRTEQTDIWSVGVIFYEMLTGCLPFQATKDMWEQIQMIRTREPDELPATVSEIVRKIVVRALKRDCAQRYLSASQMRKELREAMWQLMAPRLEAITLRAPQTLIVSTLGPAHYRTISEAIKNAEPGTRILVRPGIYNEGLVIDRRVEILADGPQDEIIIESTDSSCIIMRTDYAIVGGFTLRSRKGPDGREAFGVDIPQGRLVLEDCDISSDIGIHNACASPIIRHCKIHNSEYFGIWVDEYGQGLIEYCDIFGNKGDGILIRTGGNPTIQACKIHDMQATGIWVDKSGQGLIEDCDIYGNALGGIFIVREANPLVRMCKINRNKGYAVVAIEEGTGRIENCDLTGNRRGAKLIKDGCKVALVGNKE